MRYVQLPQILTDSTFGFFMISWLVTRHILFLFVLHSVWRHIPAVMSFGADATQGNYLSLQAWYGFSALLTALQVCYPAVLLFACG